MTLTPTLLMGHKLKRMIQVTLTIVAVSNSDSDVDGDVVWAKAGCGGWGLCRVSH